MDENVNCTVHAVGSSAAVLIIPPSVNLAQISLLLEGLPESWEPKIRSHCSSGEARVKEPKLSNTAGSKIEV